MFEFSTFLRWDERFPARVQVAGIIPRNETGCSQLETEIPTEERHLSNAGEIRGDQ